MKSDEQRRSLRTRSRVVFCSPKDPSSVPSSRAMSFSDAVNGLSEGLLARPAEEASFLQSLDHRIATKWRITNAHDAMVVDA